MKHSKEECGLLVNWQLMRKHFATPELMAAAVLPKIVSPRQRSKQVEAA